LNSEGQLKSVRDQTKDDALTGEVVGPYGMLDIQPLPVNIEGRRQKD
jgi:hypothetical protein